MSIVLDRLDRLIYAATDDDAGHLQSRVKNPCHSADKRQTGAPLADGASTIEVESGSCCQHGSQYGGDHCNCINDFHLPLSEKPATTKDFANCNIKQKEEI